MDQITPENMHIHLGYLTKKIDSLCSKLDKDNIKITDKLTAEYVTKIEFDPVKKIVDSIINRVLMLVIGGFILTLVIVLGKYYSGK